MPYRRGGSSPFIRTKEPFSEAPFLLPVRRKKRKTDCISSVSYTHLDVYKRQAHTLSGDKSLPLYDGQEATRYPERENTASSSRFKPRSTRKSFRRSCTEMRVFINTSLLPAAGCRCYSLLYHIPVSYTHLSEVLGKETIDLYNTSETRSNNNSYGLNYQKTGKELMSQDEIAVMDGAKCILQLRGVRPFLSNKYDITKHPKYRQLSDYDKRNAFDIEKYRQHKLVVKPDDTFDLRCV